LGFNTSFIALNVLLELAGEYLSPFGIEALHVGDERQQCGENDEDDDDRQDHWELLAFLLTAKDTSGIEGQRFARWFLVAPFVSTLSMSPVGSIKSVRSSCSRR